MTPDQLILLQQQIQVIHSDIAEIKDNLAKVARASMTSIKYLGEQLDAVRNVVAANLANKEEPDEQA